MSAKHTPEPWTLTEDPCRRVIKGGGAKPRTVCIIEDWTTEPDALLLAAAPALAAALEDLLGACNADNPVKGLAAEEQARAALKLAGRL